MSTFTGQPVQPKSFGVPHTFQGGLNADYAPEATPATVYTSAGNAHLLRYLGSEIEFAFDTDTIQRASLPTNHVIMGWNSRKGVLYLALGEVINGVATGRGQVGTFPAPAYTHTIPDDVTSPLLNIGQLVQEYRPLHVFLGDTPPYNTVPGPLSSLRFNFDLPRPLEVILQTSYDGSLNLLIHDRGTEAPLLINSGFVTTANGGYQLITRAGHVSTNNYNGNDFAGRMRQHLAPQTAAKLRLENVTTGGRLSGGEYRYYLLYCDADGNRSGVAAEVGPVIVFDGESPAKSHGALPTQHTGRRVRLQATGLDPTLGYVRLAWVLRTGELSAVVSQATWLAERFPIPEAGSLSILHTGLEPTQVLALEELLNLNGQLYRYATATSTEQGRLLVGNVQTRAATNSVYDLLRDYARTCTLGHGHAQMHEPGLRRSSGLSIPELYENTLQTVRQLDAYAGGTSNPLNLCYYLGYHDAEAYSWCLQAQLLDGTITDAFPTKGLDNLNGLANYVSDTAANFYDEQGWSADRKQNVAGVYRFPRRGLGNTLPMLSSDGTINVLRAELHMPAIPPALAARVRCIRIVRAPRRENRQFQGYMIPTLKALATAPEDQEYDAQDAAMQQVMLGTTISNLKVLPAPQLTLETSIHDYHNSSKQRVYNVFPFRFFGRHNYEGSVREMSDPKRYALYAPDLFLQMGNWRQSMSGSNWQVLPVALATCWREGKYTNPPKAGRTGGSWLVYKTAAHTLLPAQTLQTVKLHVTEDKQAVPNTGRFASLEYRLRGLTDSNEYFVLRSAWEEYVGVEFTTPPAARAQLNLADENPITGRKPTGYNLSDIYEQAMADPAAPLALIVDVYGTEGVWDGEALRQAYTSDNTAYFPITDWMTADEVDAQLLAGRTLALYGGDAVVGLSFRRVVRGLSATDNNEELVPVSQMMAMVTSNSVNAWARSAENDTVNSFAPLVGADTGDINQFRAFPYHTLKESMRYNAGYSPSAVDSAPPVASVRDNIALLPFVRTQYQQRVWSTPIANESALSNGWRNFPPLLFRDYDMAGGALVRLISGPRSEVLLVYENALAVIQLNERAIAGSQAGQPVYIESLELLPKRATPVATDLGCQHAFAVTMSDNAVYGFDALQNVVWRYVWGSGRAVRLSDQNVTTLLKPAAEQLRGKPVVLLSQDARLTYDPYRGDVLVSIYQRELRKLVGVPNTL